MEKHLQRFEIIRALSNAVYEASDPATGQVVQIQEWTPDRSELDRKRKAFAELVPRLSGEALSSYASLYLVRGGEAAAKADFELLRQNGLFTGAWSSDVPPPPKAGNDPPQPQPQPQPPPPIVITRGTTLGKVLAWVFVCSLGAAYVGWLAGGVGKVEQSTYDTTKSELVAARSEASSAANEAAQSSTGATGLRQRLQLYDGLHMLKLTNHCSATLKFAVRYKSLNGDWTNEGWLILAPRGSAMAAISRDPSFFVYAKSEAGDKVWTNENGSDTMTTQAADFAYTGDAPTDADSQVVKPNHYVANGDVYERDFTCPN